MVNWVECSKMKEKFPNLFSGGIGKLKGYQMKFHIDNSVKPSKQTHYRVPFHLRKLVEDELQKLDSEGIIQRATGPTSWISPIHVVPKKVPGEIRIVVDARQVNKAIKEKSIQHQQ